MRRFRLGLCSPSLATRLALCWLPAVLAGCGPAKDTILEEGSPDGASTRPASRPAANGGPLALAEPVRDTREEAADEASPKPAATTSGPGQANVKGRIHNVAYRLPEAIVLRGQAAIGGMPDTVVFAVSDTPGLCAHLQAGTMPKNSRLLALALSSDVGFVEGTHFLPGGEMGEDDAPMVTAYLRTLDDQCRIDPALGRLGALGSNGEAVLERLDAAGGTLRFRLEFEDDRHHHLGTLAGDIDATFCDAPYLFAHVMDFYQHRLAPGACR